MRVIRGCTLLLLTRVQQLFVGQESGRMFRWNRPSQEHGIDQLVFLKNATCCLVPGSVASGALVTRSLLEEDPEPAYDVDTSAGSIPRGYSSRIRKSCASVVSSQQEWGNSLLRCKYATFHFHSITCFVHDEQHQKGSRKPGATLETFSPFFYPCPYLTS